MTSTVTEVTTAAITSASYEALSISVGVITIMLLLILLILKEGMRAYGGPRSETWMETLNVAIIPLLMTFTLIMALRFGDLLRFR